MHTGIKKLKHSQIKVHLKWGQGSQNFNLSFNYPVSHHTQTPTHTQSVLTDISLCPSPSADTNSG